MVPAPLDAQHTMPAAASVADTVMTSTTSVTSRRAKGDAHGSGTQTGPALGGDSGLFMADIVAPPRVGRSPTATD